MVLPLNLSSSSFESELAEVAPYDDCLEPLATEEEAVSQCKNAEQISQLSQITNTEILVIIQQI